MCDKYSLLFGDLAGEDDTPPFLSSFVKILNPLVVGATGDADDPPNLKQEATGVAAVADELLASDLEPNVNPPESTRPCRT